MPTVTQIAMICSSAVVGIIGFLLKNAITGFNSRLDKLESKFTEFIAVMSAQNVEIKSSKDEIMMLRKSHHELRNEVQVIKSVQERCSSCNRKG